MSHQSHGNRDRSVGTFGGLRVDNKLVREYFELKLRQVDKIFDDLHG